MSLSFAEPYYDVSSGGFQKSRTTTRVINTKTTSLDLGETVISTFQVKTGIAQLQSTNTIDQTFSISSLGSPKYDLNRPIHISISQIDEDEYIAVEPESGLAICGDSPTEALQSIKVELAEVFDLYSSSSNLGPEPKRQLAILEKYIGKRKRK